MTLYRYEAISKEGKKTFGVVNADSYDLAKDVLRKQKILVVKLATYKDRKKSVKVPYSLLLSFTRDASQLLKAGLPLYETLLAIEEKYRATQAHPLFLDLCDKVKHGKHLSAALSAYPGAFDQIYVSMIASAEETGSLPEVFMQLEQLISRQQKLKKQLGSAMIYPLFLLSFCMIVVTALFFFLIPSMQQLFEGRQLHPMTQVVLNISLFLRTYGAMMGGGLACIVLGIIFFFSTKRGKLALQKGLLQLPLISRMITQAVLVRFCRALSVMLSSSVALIDALRLSKKIMSNPCFEEIVTNAEKKIMQGGKLSEELSKSSLIPALMIRMLSIAEEAGNTSEMLKNIAEIYEEELEKSLTRITAMLQPVMLLFLAVVVGIVILSILLPLTDVGSFLNN